MKSFFSIAVCIIRYRPSDASPKKQKTTESLNRSSLNTVQEIYLSKRFKIAILTQKSCKFDAKSIHLNCVLRTTNASLSLSRPRMCWSKKSKFWHHTKVRFRTIFLQVHTKINRFRCFYHTFVHQKIVLPNLCRSMDSASGGARWQNLKNKAWLSSISRSLTLLPTNDATHLARIKFNFDLCIWKSFLSNFFAVLMYFTIQMECSVCKIELMNFEIQI